MVQLTRELRRHLTIPNRDGPQLASNSWSGVLSDQTVCPFIRLRATLESEIDPVTGYVCDVKLVDEALNQALFNATRAGLPEHHVSLVCRLWEELTSGGIGSNATSLEIAFSDYLRMGKDAKEPAMITIAQQYEFSAAHRLHADQLSDEENRELFGKCNHPHGHGHNYVLDVVLGVEASPSGRDFALDNMNAIVKEEVIARLDHKHLNLDVDAFRELNPTVENIARVIFGWLSGSFPAARLERIRLYETPKTWAEVTASPASGQSASTAGSGRHG